jgi:formylglycine-generating enzyme required for sulfatase activity
MMRRCCPPGHSPTSVMPSPWSMLGAAAILAAVAISALALAHGAGRASPEPGALRLPIPDLVELPAGHFRYRAAGEFSRNGRPVTAPVVTAEIKRKLAVMRHQVTAADYQRCVEAEACPVVDGDGAVPGLPMVKVSWRDAHAYASWLSRETGERFRLPTDEEWAYAAAGRFQDDALPENLDAGNDSQRRLAIYDRDASRQETLDPTPRPVGNFGANENGLLDMAGNVWEWTNICYTRNALDAHGGVVATTANCGIRVVEGRHRTYMSDFIRDARAGGCSIGTPPRNLGFRIVRDDDPWGVGPPLSVWARHLVGLRIRQLRS